MSSPAQRDHDSDDLSRYAPRWARDKRTDRRPRWDDDRNTAPAAPSSDWPTRDEGAADSDGLVIDRVRVPRSLEPGFVPEPPPAAKRPTTRSTATRIVLACAAAGGIAYVAVVRTPDFFATDARESDTTHFSTRFEGQGTRPAERSKVAAQLVATPPASRAVGEAAQLGLSLRGGGEGTSVLVAGLPAGATLSAGYPFGAGGWRVPAAELSGVQVYPPRGFVGAMEIGIELREGDDTVADRRAVRLEWTVPKPVEKAAAPPPPPPFAMPPVALPPVTMPPVAMPPVAVPPVAKAPEPPPPPGAVAGQAQQPQAAPARPARMLDRDELEVLIRRGEEFLASGDVSAARVTLKRAAEAQDARAALALASTYDPIVLERLGVLGFKPDIAMARAWYEKARAFGSPDAPRRLEMLASRER